VYMHVKRSLIPPLLAAFDFPDVDSSCEARFVTTQPQQSLAMLNGHFFNEQAAQLAQRIAAQQQDPQMQVSQVIQLALGREPTETEVSEGLKFMRRLKDHHQQDAGQALFYWCLTVLNLNEFVYLD